MRVEPDRGRLRTADDGDDCSKAELSPKVHKLPQQSRANAAAHCIGTVPNAVTPVVDVSMVKTLVTAGPFAVGQTVNYTLVIANAGPSTATNISVTDRGL